MKNNKNGFIALISVILIGGMLMALALSEDLAGFYSRSAIRDHESKIESKALADACVDTVIQKLSVDATYSGGDTIAVGPDACTIFPGAAGDPRTFFIQAQYHHSYTNLKVEITIATLLLLSREEIATL
jgi:hypothetical protein